MRRRQKIEMRIVVGLSGNSTNPVALRSLQEFAAVRVARGGNGIFHPKFYLFDSAGETICWVGSANFTFQGFMVNSELVNEFGDNGTARRWFESLWNSLNSDSDDEIMQYVDNWTKPPGTTGKKTASAGSITSEDPVRLLQAALRTWNEYVVALRRCDAYWKEKEGNFSVLDLERSWLETIALGRELIRRGIGTHSQPKRLACYSAAASGVSSAQ